VNVSGAGYQAISGPLFDGGVPKHTDVDQGRLVR
jgi:hypothetical protein